MNRSLPPALLRRHGADVSCAFVALVLFSIAWPVFWETHGAPTVVVPFLAALGTLPVVAAYRAPVVAWTIVASACLLVVPLRSNPEFLLGWPVPFHLALVACLIGVITRSGLREIAGVVAATIVLMAFNPGFDQKVGWMLGAATFSLLVFLLRWLVVSRRQLRTSSAQLEREAARSNEQADLRILAEERNRLARDLHDVVAHQMSMIVVQSQSAPYRLQGVTPAVHAEFDSISETARSALDEVRGLLGVLRSDAETPGVEPVGADQLVPTLQAARRSGVDITWTIDGDLQRVDDTAGVVLQRVLQESLSNAARHAPGGAVLVALSVTDPDGQDAGGPSVTLEVDNGPAADDAVAVPESGGGSGIKGMSARVRAVGGSFSALPAADGGFSVTATVPVRASARR